MYLFSFKGGCAKPRQHQSEKFLIYFLAGNREIPFYTLKKQDIIRHAYIASADYHKLSMAVPDNNISVSPHHAIELFDKYGIQDFYVSPYKIVKVFLYQGGFGIPKRYHSFYFEISPTVEANHYKIHSFDKEVGFFFNAPGRFLKNQEVADIVRIENSKSIDFYLTQKGLPIATIKDIIKVKKYYRPVKAGRTIRVLG